MGQKRSGPTVGGRFRGNAYPTQQPQSGPLRDSRGGGERCSLILEVDLSSGGDEADHVNLVQAITSIALPMEGEEPDPWWVTITPLVLALGRATFYLIRWLRRRRR